MGMFGLVRGFALRITNGRTRHSVFNALLGEVAELHEEIYRKETGEEAGPDGIIGEAIDVINCAIDLIVMEAPDMTEEQANAIQLLKLQKWERKYG